VTTKQEQMVTNNACGLTEPKAEERLSSYATEFMASTQAPS